MVDHRSAGYGEQPSLLALDWCSVLEGVEKVHKHVVRNFLRYGRIQPSAYEESVNPAAGGLIQNADPPLKLLGSSVEDVRPSRSRGCAGVERGMR